MLPTLAVSVLPVPVCFEKLAVPIGKGFALLLEVAKPGPGIYSSGFSCVEPYGSLINRHCLTKGEGNALNGREN
ncbi:Uncharacterised protein [Salmonella enterica subsp. enterica]|uniref:Uncharacterized protein n=1 Tax=Salmonella enterica I TaxID=59201 RepID=A0A379WSM6_SALET|nr:Uncharacterised protein [Salmonella enterica subsp. enterica]